MSFKSNTCIGQNGSLTSYQNIKEAREAANYQNRYSGFDFKLEPYQCKKCGYFHLGRADRNTHNERSSCLDSNGRPKDGYPTQEDAQRRAEIIKEEKGITLFTYKCPYCMNWHLTHTRYY